jgi:hypothetical protein
VRVFLYRGVLCKSVEVHGVSEVSPKNYETQLQKTSNEKKNINQISKIIT